ncbi:MAG: ATP-dependent Clp protease ATP-binding subunit [Candidatus Moraniibacteriota bacterium]|nr:MAG: ATP-dependent Clp protease ATP-binding subunit [Candidatus Moranbacteria bacterium]
MPIRLRMLCFAKAFDFSRLRWFNEPMKKLSQTHDFLGKLSGHARHILRVAFSVARENKRDVIRPEHLFVAILLEKKSLGSILLKRFGITEKDIETILRPPSSSVRKGRTLLERTPAVSRETRDIVANAFLLANRFSYPYVGSEHLVHALLDSGTRAVTNLLNRKRVPPEAGEQAGEEPLVPENESKEASKEASISLPELPGFSKLFPFPSLGFPFEEQNGNREESDTPALDQFGVTLGKDRPRSREHSRTREREAILRTLARKTKQNPLLIGPPGVGKTTIVESVAELLAAGAGGHTLEGKRIVSLDLGALVAGTSFRGEFESRLKDVLREAKEHPDIILFLDEIHTLIGAGNANGGLDAANMLKPALSRGEVRCIGATTLSEYRRHIEKDPALERRFHVIRIEEPSVEESIRILEESVPEYETHHRLSISKEAVHAAVSLGVRHLPSRFLPDKAFDILDEAAALLRREHDATQPEDHRRELISAHETLLAKKHELIRNKKFEEAKALHIEESALEEQLNHMERLRKEREKKHRLVLSRETVEKAAALLSGTPLEQITRETLAARKTLLPQLSEKIIGQESVLSALSEAILRAKLGLGRDPKRTRPLGSFLFLGPSGVGKTLTARTLSEVLFEGKTSFLRFDMSEFREHHHLTQLVGSPAGYVGFGEGGVLTEHLRHHPSSVILFDEIEKAHPDVLNILLQILEEGILTDAEGKRAHFGESIIILTSNIGSALFEKDTKLGFSETDAAAHSFDQTAHEVQSALKREMRPELLARLDHVLVFRPLSEEALEKIALLEGKALEEALRKNGMRLSIPKSVFRFLAKKSAQEKEGARSIRKNMQNLIENPISSLLLAESNLPAEIFVTLEKNCIHVRV